MKQLAPLVLGIALSLPLSTAAMAENDEDEFANPDPWVRANRVTHNFNDFADRILLRPVAVAYSKVIPGFARRGVGTICFI